MLVLGLVLRLGLCLTEMKYLALDLALWLWYLLTTLRKTYPNSGIALAQSAMTLITYPLVG